jgi:aryl-alcohol dehydrogenase-like predicted oxidoreductase
LFTRVAESDVLATCDELGITFVAYSPLGRGMLTGASDVSGDGDMRKALPRFQLKAAEQNQTLVNQLIEISNSLGAMPAQVAIAWILSRPEVIIPIPWLSASRTHP